MLRFQWNTEVSPEYWGFTGILMFHPNAKVSPDYSGCTWIQRFHQCRFRLLMLMDFPKTGFPKEVITRHIFELRIYWPTPQAGHFEFDNFGKIEMGARTLKFVLCFLSRAVGRRPPVKCTYRCLRKKACGPMFCIQRRPRFWFDSSETCSTQIAVKEVGFET